MKTRSPKVTILCKIRPCSDENICIVPYPDSKSIVASHSPLKQLRSPDMKDPVQLNSLKSTLLEESQMMRFDSVIPGEVSQSKFYTHHLENSVVQMIAGRNLCVMVLGISTSGKSYTMRGNDGHNKGLVMRTVETLSHQITQNHLGLQIKFAAVAISGDSLFDLMNSEEPLIRNINDLTIAIREALGNRNLIVNNENKSKMHFMITLRLFQGQKEISRSDFLEFAGSEYVKEDKSIARALNSISYTLTNSCKNKRENLLSDYLKTTLDVYNPTNPSHAILICCVSPSPKHYKDSLPILKFISRVKECIDEQKLSSKDDLKTLKFQFYTEKHELERLYKDKISSLESKYAREIKRLLDYINELKELLYSNKRINIENESTGLFSDLVSVTDIKHDKKVKGIESVIEESTIDPDSPLRKKPNINPKEILDLKDKLNKQDYLLKQKDKLIQEMLSINPSPEPQTKRRSYNRSVERESESDLQKRNFKMIEDSYTKKIDLLSNQLLKYQDLTKEINAELKSAKTEKVTI